MCRRDPVLQLCRLRFLIRCVVLAVEADLLGGQCILHRDTKSAVSQSIFNHFPPDKVITQWENILYNFYILSFSVAVVVLLISSVLHFQACPRAPALFALAPWFFNLTSPKSVQI